MMNSRVLDFPCLSDQCLPADPLLSIYREGYDKGIALQVNPNSGEFLQALYFLDIITKIIQTQGKYPELFGNYGSTEPAKPTADVPLPTTAADATDFPPLPAASKAEGQGNPPAKKRKKRKAKSEVPELHVSEPPAQMEVEPEPIDDLVIDLFGTVTGGQNIAPAGYNGAQSCPTPAAEVTSPAVTSTDPAPTLPIYLKTTENFVKVLSDISDNFPDSFSSKSAGMFIRISPVNEVARFSIMAFLQSKKHDFFIGSCAPFKVVIKGLPTETECSSLITELTSQGFAPLKVSQLTMRRTRLPLSMFLVEIPNAPHANQILRLKTLFTLDVKVEPYRKRRGHIQCFNCNWFDHTSDQCFMAPRCLKCGDAHPTRDCVLPKSTNPLCINCSEHGHVACSRRCPKFPRDVPRRPTDKIRPVRRPTTRKPPESKICPNHLNPPALLPRPLLLRPNHLNSPSYPVTSKQPKEVALVFELLSEITPIFAGEDGIKSLINLLRSQKTALGKLQVFFDFFASRAAEPESPPTGQSEVSTV